MDLNVKLQVFEGPLDLLLHLLEKNKVNIYDIPIVEITNQYMDYIRQMQQESLDVMSEFLVMAATLLDIKSRMLLPKEETEDEEEEDPRAELVQKLLEYKMYKCMSLELRDMQVDAGRRMYKPPTVPAEVLAYREPVDLDKLVAGIDLERLNSIYHSILRKQVDKVDPVRSKFGRIEKEEVSLDEKLTSLEQYAAEHTEFLFSQLFEHAHSKVQVIVTFLAVLELMKMGKIEVSQEYIFDDIRIYSKVAEG